MVAVAESRSDVVVWQDAGWWHKWAGKAAVDVGRAAVVGSLGLFDSGVEKMLGVGFGTVVAPAMVASEAGMASSLVRLRDGMVRRLMGWACGPEQEYETQTVRCD